MIFNHLEQTWYYGTLARTAWVDSPLREFPTAAGYNGQIIYHEDGVDEAQPTHLLLSLLTANLPTSILVMDTTLALCGASFLM